MNDTNTRRRVWRSLGVICCCLLAVWGQGCATPKTAKVYTNLDATLWAQTAAEHEAAVGAVFARARERIPDLARGPGASALAEPEPAGPDAAKPLAIVTDIDETLLDNSPFQGELVLRGLDFDKALWGRWVRLAQAQALPGAVECCQRAKAAGITVIYITNRGDGESAEERQRQEEATRRNLQALGFPLASDFDCVLMPGEQPDWGTDKSTRRAYVAARYRVVALLGDDLGDFASVVGLNLEERRELVRKHHGRWGNTWFLLPDPMYGSWVKAVTKSSPSPNPLDAKLNALRRLPAESARP